MQRQPAFKLDTSKTRDLDVRFKDDVDIQRRTIRSGALLLNVALWFLCLGRVTMFAMREKWRLESNDCDSFPGTLSLRLLVLLVEVNLTALMSKLLWKLRADMYSQQKVLPVCLYYGCSLFILIYSLVIFIPPLGSTCDDLIKIAQCHQSKVTWSRVAEVACGLQATTPIMVSMCVLFLDGSTGLL
jgi:hypothetical protein